MHNRQGLTPSLLLNALLDFDLWPIYLLGLTWSIPATPITAYITLNLKALGFNTFQTNLLTVPAYVLFLLQLIWWTWFSERVKGHYRFWIVLTSQIWMLPLVLALELLPAKASPWAWYAVSALLVGYPYIHAILGGSLHLPNAVLRLVCTDSAASVVAITSRNAGSVRTRTVGSAMYNMCVQASNIISSNVRHFVA